MNPSTTVRDSSSSEVIRASTSGAKNLGAPEYDCAVCPFDEPFVSVFFSLRQFIFIFRFCKRRRVRLVHQQRTQFNPDFGSETVSTSLLIT